MLRRPSETLPALSAFHFDLETHNRIFISRLYAYARWQLRLSV